ncbi:MAG TPA: hypothetical protein VGP08_15195 [Pyrinomonadaceae bacterium]|jgi:hypothetical protein|nr:hypothetical protein [Pyrinomonadaceae bacterium]
MLLIQTNSLSLSPNVAERLRLLDALASKGLTPLIRSARRRFFQLLAPQEGPVAEELEGECAARQEDAGGAVYTPGELFCVGDCVMSLVFGTGAEGTVQAGVIYDVHTAAPLNRLERFCQDVLAAAAESVTPSQEGTTAQLDLWKPGAGRSLPQGLARFIASQPPGFVRAAALRGGREVRRASELMEEHSVRTFLRRVQELRREGYSPRRLITEAGALGVTVEEMTDAGLLEREVRVSCRKSGHALFDLPSPDSLAAVTISRAKCSQCASLVADEVIEETYSPTRLAVALLEDGGWLANRVHTIVRSLGVPDSEIATGPASPDGESYLAADVCGTSFLFVTRDGDLTPAFSRRVAGVVEDTDAAHLVVVVTGAIEDEGRMRLYEFAWRRARDAQDMATTLIEGLDDARLQIERAFRGAARRELSRHLFTLDAALGFSAADFVLGWFASAKTAGEWSRGQTVGGARIDHDAEAQAGDDSPISADSPVDTADYLPPSRA